MHFKNPFIRNWSLLTISNILCQALGMLATIRIARVLAPEGFGFLGIVQVNAGIGVVLAGLGLQKVITRECARYPEKSLSLFRNTLLAQALLFLPVGIGLVFYSVWLSGTLPLSLGGISVLLFWGMLMWQLVESVAFGHERMEFSSILNFAGSVLWVVFAWAAPVAILTPFIVCLVFAVLQGIKSTGYLLGIIKAGLLKSGPHTVTIKFLLNRSLPFYWLAILTAASNQLPILFLTERSGAVEVGLYSAGLKLSRPMTMMIQTLMLSLYPGFSRLAVADPERYLLLIQKSLLGLVVAGALLASFITVFRIEIVKVLFGSQFHGAADSLMLQIWYFMTLCIFNLIGVTLAASDRQNWLARLSTFYALVAVPLLWFGSAHGAKGLAAALLGAALLNMTYHWYFFQKSLAQRLSLSFTLTLFGIPLLLALLSSLLSPDISIYWRLSGIIMFAGLSCALAWKQASRLQMVPK